MYFWERYGNVQQENPQPFAKDRVYVTQGIVDYAKAAGIPIAHYCRQIEREVPTNPETQFIPYNNQNHQHVSDVIDEGCLLVGNSSVRANNALKLGVQEGNKPITPHEREAASTFVKAVRGANPQKEGLINALNSAGISYTKTPTLTDRGIK